MWTIESILKLLDVLAKYEMHDDIWWRTDSQYAPVTFFINCNDLFYWASADCEEVYPNTIDELAQACADCVKTGIYGFYGSLLYCCRKRNMRPQGAYYKHLPKEIWQLLDALPEREAPGGAFGNTSKPIITLTQQELENNRIKNAVERERKACAELAWKMQMTQFGGGTAIGNSIQERGNL